MLDPAQGRSAPTSPQVLESLLLGEWAHRTVNDFSSASAAVRMASLRSSNSDVLDLLGLLATRFDALGSIQRLLQAPDRARQMDLTVQMNELCQAMVSARFADRGIKLLFQADDIIIEGGRGWRILLIVAELLVNAARHAFGTKAGSVHVTLFARDADILCAIRDDGCGRPLHGTDRWGYGSSVVQLLAGEIDGDLRIDSTPAGTLVELILPRSAEPRTVLLDSASSTKESDLISNES